MAITKKEAADLKLAVEHLLKSKPEKYPTIKSMMDVPRYILDGDLRTAAIEVGRSRKPWWKF